MMKKFFYIFLILNLIIQIPVFADKTDKGKLTVNVKKLCSFIAKKLNSGCVFDESFRDQIIEQTESIVGPNDFNKQYELLRITIKNGSKFSDKYKFLDDSSSDSDKVYELLGEASQEIKRKHPDEVKPEKTVMFSHVSTFISKTEIDDAITNGGGSGVFASSMIEGDTVKPKQNESDYDRLKSDNEQLKTKNNLLSMLIESLKNEKSELMDRQVELSAENGGLKAENNGLKEKVTNFEKLVAELKEKIANLERDMEESKSLNSLYEQVVGIYQQIVKSKYDFERIMKLMKQIEGKKDEK